METTPSLRIIPTSDLLFEDRGWTRGHAHAGFDDVPRHSPGFLDFAPARLAVYQTMDAGTGYPLHAHEGVETMFFVLEGTCLHEDSAGGRTRVSADSVAVLSAGRGVSHAEFADDSGPLRAVMFWVSDGDPAGAPRFQSRSAPRAERLNRFRVLAGNDELPLRQRARMLGAYLEADRSVTLDLPAGRRAYLLATDAAIEVNGRPAQAGDRVLLEGLSQLEIRALGATEVVLLEV
jgi:redox-sensitive bicupin YhaK (pirin superfamily)